MLRIWGRRSSFNVQKVLWFAGELGLAYEHISAGGDFGLVSTPDFLAMNPHGRVPVIDDGGTVVWESHAILRYLAARYGAPRFWHADPGQRSEAERWMDWAQTALQPAFLGGVFWGYYRTPRALRDPVRIREQVELSAAYFTLLDGVLRDRPFLGGAVLTLADIPAGTALYRYFEIDIERPEIPHVRAWYQRLQQRQPYRAHVMVPFGELYGKLDY